MQYLILIYENEAEAETRAPEERPRTRRTRWGRARSRTIGCD